MTRRKKSAPSSEVKEFMAEDKIQDAKLAEKVFNGGGRRSRLGGRERNGSTADAVFSKMASSPLYPLGGKSPLVYANKMVTTKVSSGLEFGSYYTRDPFRSKKTEAIILEYAQVTWAAFQVTNPGTADTTANNLGTRVLAMFNNLTDVINFNGRFVPVNALTSANDFAVYINSYSVAFSILWTYLSAFEALEVNTSSKSFGGGIGKAGNISRAAELWRRLQLVPIPPGLPKFLAQITGVFYSEIEDMLIYAYINTAASPTVVTDWTLATGALSVDVLLSLAETDIAGLESSTSEANLVAETFAIAYGVPRPLPTPMIHSNPSSFDLHFTRASVFIDDEDLYAQPSANGGGAGATIPILVRKGHEKDPINNIAFSLLRPQLYDAATDGANATSSPVGLLINNSNSGGNFGRYYGPAAANNSIIQDNTFAALNYGDGSFLEVEFWASFVQSTSGIVNWRNDARSYDRWTSFYPNVAALGDQSLVLLNQIFFDGLMVRTLR